jgi:hypothetical protein
LAAPFKGPVTDVCKVIAGVVVAVATVPENPLAETTEALVTVPEPPPPVAFKTLLLNERFVPRVQFVGGPTAPVGLQTSVSAGRPGATCAWAAGITKSRNKRYLMAYPAKIKFVPLKVIRAAVCGPK